MPKGRTRMVLLRLARFLKIPFPELDGGFDGLLATADLHLLFGGKVT